MRKKVFGLGLAISLWLMVSPWMLGFASIEVAKWNNLVLGVFLVLAWLWSYFGEWED